MTFKFTRLWVPFVCLTAICAPAWAEDKALTADQTSQLKAYLAKEPVSPKSLLKQIARQAPVVSGINSAAEAVAISASRASTIGADKDEPAVATTHSRSMLAMLDAPETTPGSLTRGLGTGLGVQPSPALAHRAAQAIVAAMKRPERRTADDAAALAAALATDAAPADAALQERLVLARAVFQVDGTDALIRQYVGTDYMRMIVTELAKHIDFSKLSESDKYRLTAIVTVAQTELAEKIVLMNARMQAENLSKAELTQLLAAYDIDPQRKLTAMRLGDDGKVDRAAELDIRLAQYQMVKLFEAVP